jgi:hypothetical protein
MIYLCYDTALNEEYTLVKLMQIYPVYISLFTGTNDEDIWDAAPYLFEVSNNFYQLREDPFIQLDHCILFETSETKEEVCRFLQYYMYKKEEDKTAYIRIWDARILIKHLQGWNEKEKIQFFEFFKAVYTEPEDGAWLEKWQLARFNKPVATPVLKTEVLAHAVAAFSGFNSSSAIAVGPVATSGIDTDILPAQTEHQPPKRRRFFID